MREFACYLMKLCLPQHSQESSVSLQPYAGPSDFNWKIETENNSVTQTIHSEPKPTRLDVFRAVY